MLSAWFLLVLLAMNSKPRLASVPRSVPSAAARRRAAIDEVVQASRVLVAAARMAGLIQASDDPDIDDDEQGPKVFFDLGGGEVRLFRVLAADGRAVETDIDCN